MEAAAAAPDAQRVRFVPALAEAARTLPLRATTTAPCQRTDARTNGDVEGSCAATATAAARTISLLTPLG
jgi:hypothetical protein